MDVGEKEVVKMIEEKNMKLNEDENYYCMSYVLKDILLVG